MSHDLISLEEGPAPVKCLRYTSLNVASDKECQKCIDEYNRKYQEEYGVWSPDVQPGQTCYGECAKYGEKYNGPGHVCI